MQDYGPEDEEFYGQEGDEYYAEQENY